VVPLAGPRIDARGYWWIARHEVAQAPLVEQFCAWLQEQGDQAEDAEKALLTDDAPIAR
jgi:LysR family glycine cleavage system transcriptional activator